MSKKQETHADLQGQLCKHAGRAIVLKRIEARAYVDHDVNRHSLAGNTLRRDAHVVGQHANLRGREGAQRSRKRRQGRHGAPLIEEHGNGGCQ